MYKSALIENVNHQNLYLLSQLEPRTEGELAMKEAAQKELFRRIDSHQRVKTRKPKPVPQAEVTETQEQA